jgi:hypothetical protein
MNIDETLKERGARYGSFDDHARITQEIKRAMKDSKNWDHLDDGMTEALEMIAHKIGRILNGDPMYIEYLRDIIGYAQLVVNILEKQDGSTDSKTINMVRSYGIWKEVE